MQATTVGLAAALEEDREQRFSAKEEARNAERAEQRRCVVDVCDG